MFLLTPDLNQTKTYVCGCNNQYCGCDTKLTCWYLLQTHQVVDTRCKLMIPCAQPMMWIIYAKAYVTYDMFALIKARYVAYNESNSSYSTYLLNGFFCFLLGRELRRENSISASSDKKKAWIQTAVVLLSTNYVCHYLQTLYEQNPTAPIFVCVSVFEQAQTLVQVDALEILCNTL